MPPRKATARRAAGSSRVDPVVERLDLILRVAALQVGADKSVTERVRLLKLAGLDNQTIADVLNTTPATVRALASNLRTRRRIAP
jgi:DNA-binding CsgD family transcriptional regulator